MAALYEFVYGVDPQKPYKHTFTSGVQPTLVDQDYTVGEIEDYVSTNGWWNNIPDSVMFIQALSFVWQKVVHSDEAIYFAGNIYQSPGGVSTADDFELIYTASLVNFNFGYTPRTRRLYPAAVAGLQGRGDNSKGNRIYAVGFLGDLLNFTEDDTPLGIATALDLTNPPVLSEFASIYEAYRNYAPIQTSNAGVQTAMQTTTIARKVYKGVRRS